MTADPDSGATISALDQTRIRRLLDRQPALVLHVEQEVDSTSDYLARLRKAGQAVDVVVADAQSAGRGRRGRRWISPSGAGLYLSYFRSFDRPVRQLTALGLAAGVAAAEAIEEYCNTPIGLKWPNDLQINGRKVAGCLVDSESVAGASTAIIRLGINVDFREPPVPDQPWTDLVAVTGRAVDRNRLAAILIRRLATHLDEFNKSGFANLKEQWAHRDVPHGQNIQAIGQDHKVIHGRAAGVDESGQLLVDDQGRLRRLHGGEVALQKQP